MSELRVVHLVCPGEGDDAWTACSAFIDESRTVGEHLVCGVGSSDDRRRAAAFGLAIDLFAVPLGGAIPNLLAGGSWRVPPRFTRGVRERLARGAAWEWANPDAPGVVVCWGERACDADATLDWLRGSAVPGCAEAAGGVGGGGGGGRLGDAGAEADWEVRASRGARASALPRVAVVARGPEPEGTCWSGRRRAVAAAAGRGAVIVAIGDQVRSDWRNIVGPDVRGIPTPSPAPRVAEPRAEIRERLSIDGDSFAVALLGDSESVSDSRRFSFVLGLMHAAGLRVVGVVSRRSAGLRRSARYTRAHTRRWGLVALDEPLVSVVHACDAAVVMSTALDLDAARRVGPTAIATALDAGVPVVIPKGGLSREIYGFPAALPSLPDDGSGRQGDRTAPALPMKAVSAPPSALACVPENAAVTQVCLALRTLLCDASARAAAIHAWRESGATGCAGHNDAFARSLERILREAAGIPAYLDAVRPYCHEDLREPQRIVRR